MLEHRPAFDSLQQDAGRRIAAIERVDLCVTPVRGRGLLLLQTTHVAALQEALSDAVGLTLPPAQRAAVAGGYVILPLTPAEWLLELPAAEIDSIGAALSRRLAASLAAVTDISDALVSIDVSGAGAAEVLMTGCSLDLRREAFPAGQAARTALAEVPVILWNAGNAHGIRCTMDRGFAGHILTWLEGTTPQ